MSHSKAHGRTGTLAGAAIGAAVLGMALLQTEPAQTETAEPSAPPRTLDMSRLKLSFSEDFNSLDVSKWGPGTRWIAHTPWAGDFGDARFADPGPSFPFTTSGGMLRIEARKFPDGHWESGLLSGGDDKGNGFSQKFGYFEMRAKFPPGPGTWPAFWLIGTDKRRGSSEIDVVEYYGQFDNVYHSSIKLWVNGKDTLGQDSKILVPPGQLVNQFNTFGVEISEDWTVFYLNREEKLRYRTPEQYKQPFYMLLNLALGGGWPIDKTISPSYMYVDYVRAYRRVAPQ